VLVVVDVMARVAVVAVDVVDVTLVRHGDVPAAVLVDVHVAGVREVEVRRVEGGVDIVHVILVDVVDVPVMQEVDVVLVRDRGVATEPVVDVRVLPERVVGSGFCHRHLRPPR
jgi:hypothetical protein